MTQLDELAKSYLAFEKSDKSEFRRKARILQSMWRSEKGYKPGMFHGREIGSLMSMPEAEENLNNYLSETIKEVVRNEVIENPMKGKLFKRDRIFNNLLSSQPLCFNLFAELQQNLELATKVFNKLVPELIKQVTKIEFEYSPGRRDPKYTGDRTASDVYVEFKNFKDGDGFIGIEVKYHENMIGDEKIKKPEKLKRYREIANEMKCFRDGCINKLLQSPLSQIWRDHLLVGSILNIGDFENGFFVFLYPKENIHCREAVEDYKQYLTNDKTLKVWFLEDVAKAIKEETNEKWIEELINRYLNFEKISELM